MTALAHGTTGPFRKSNAFIMEATVVTLSTSAEIETAIYLDPVDVGRFVDTDELAILMTCAQMHGHYHIRCPIMSRVRA